MASQGSAAAVKDNLHRLADQLPDDATWDDVMYEVYVMRKIERGLADAEAGRTYSLEAVKRELGLGS